MAINTNMLRGKLVEKNIKQEELARELGVDPSTFSRKMASNGDSFTVRQMQQMVEYLRLTDDEATSIFLVKNSHKRECCHGE